MCSDRLASLPRRQFLAGLTALGTGVLLARDESLAQTGRLAAGRIDVHDHFVPPNLLKALGTQRLGGASATWSPAKSIEDMDQAGVSTGMCSIASPEIRSTTLPPHPFLHQSMNMPRAFLPTIPPASASSPRCRCPMSMPTC